MAAPPPSSPQSSPSPEGDEAAYREIATTLADAVDEVLVQWVLTLVLERCTSAGIEVNDAMRSSADAAARACRAEYGPRVRELVLSDIDEQSTTPLALLRAATRYPTQVLADVGVAPAERDEFAQRAFPADVYALSPASFADIDERLREPGLVWGAAKAHLHLARRRA